MYQTDEYTKPRLDCIKKNLPYKNSEFSLVDWGSAEGKFALSIAEEYTLAEIVSVESNEQPTFDKMKPTDEQRLMKNRMKLKNLQIFDVKVDTDLIYKLNDISNGPVFDYQLLLNILHHFKLSKIEWKEFVWEYLKLARISFVSLPTKKELSRDTLWNVESLREYYGNLEGPLDLLMSITYPKMRVTSIGSFQNYTKDDERDIFMVENLDRKFPVNGFFINEMVKREKR